MTRAKIRLNLGVALLELTRYADAEVQFRRALALERLGRSDEALAIADRILVVHDGAVTECAHDRDAVGRAMLGVA